MKFSINARGEDFISAYEKFVKKQLLYVFIIFLVASSVVILNPENFKHPYTGVITIVIVFVFIMFTLFKSSIKKRAVMRSTIKNIYFHDQATMIVTCCKCLWGGEQRFEFNNIDVTGKPVNKSPLSFVDLELNIIACSFTELNDDLFLVKEHWDNFKDVSQALKL